MADLEKSRQLRIIAPIGDVPPVDKELHARIEQLLAHNASISDVLREISDWEEIAVQKFKEHERTAKSGMLDVTCW